MNLLKRTFASLGLAALVAVSGVALADENDDVTTTSDVAVSDVTTPDAVASSMTTDTTTDDADNDANDSDDSPALAPNGAPYCPTLRDAESIDVVGVRPDWSSVGSEGFEFHTGIVDANDVDEDALMAVFQENEYASYEEFEELLKPFEIDLSKIRGIQNVTVTHTHGGTCTGSDWHGSAALSATMYRFEVAFPITSNPVYEMPMYFDGKELQSYVPLKETDGIDPNFDRLVALNGKEMTVDEFLAQMKKIGAYMGDFPKAGEVDKGKHTVQFADFDYTYPVVTVVYPDKNASGNGSGQSKPKPTNSSTVKPGNSSNSNTVRPSTMSYIQFRGNSGSPVSTVGTSPVAGTPTPGAAPTPSEGPEGGTTVTPNPKPTLPTTGPNASAVDKEGETSPAALIALAACVGLGVVAAASVIAVRRFKR